LTGIDKEVSHSFEDETIEAKTRWFCKKRGQSKKSYNDPYNASNVFRASLISSINFRGSTREGSNPNCS